MENIQIISIEGNIGSGKSTLLHNLKNYFINNKYVTFLREPVDEWNDITDDNGVTILEKFYNNQNDYSFPFQIMAYISRLNLLKNTIADIKTKFKNNSYTYTQPFIIITERSLFTDRMVFAKMLYDNNKMELINYKIYLKWFDTFVDEFPVNKIIYVKANPEICHDRIHIRNRNGENNIPLSYLITCEKYHENMLNIESPDCVCRKQLILDGNQDINIKTNIINEWTQQIEQFINETL